LRKEPITMSALFNPIRRRLGLALSCSLLIFVMPASAHDLTVEAKVRAGMIDVRAVFTDGRPVKAGLARLFDADDRLLAERPLKSDGTAIFSIPHATQGVRVQVDLPDQHEAYWILTADDLREKK
jgi:nickel transport protein